MRKLLTIWLAVSFSLSLFSQTATFNITSNGTNAAIDSAIEYTTNIWSQYLNSAVPIKVRINYQSLSSAGPLGITFPNGVKNFPGTPVADVWYPYALANAITGTELNPGELDMEIFINSFFNMYFGTDGNPPAGVYDFVSLLLHEICHGLGFVSLAKVDVNQGSFGELTAADFAPISPSFPFPDLEGKPSIYDVYLWEANSDSLVDTTLFPNPGTALEAAFTGNDVVIRGGDLFSNITPPKIYAPVNFALGSSISHLDEQSFPASDSNSLMTPFLSTSEVEHFPGGITLEILSKLGWPDEISGIKENLNSRFLFYPNPSNGRLYNRSEVNAEVFIYDLLGQLVFQTEITSANRDVILDLMDGIYIAELKTANNLRLFQNILIINDH
ncbi:MAG: T9SS type A sorting domain-containing protein [Chitinophagales bacterium]|nr:T9SS type A sorting domain-containing protein [Chitinophagales bacterium]